MLVAFHIFINPLLFFQLPEQVGGLLLHVVQDINFDVQIIDFAKILNDLIDADFEIIIHF